VPQYALNIATYFSAGGMLASVAPANAANKVAKTGSAKQV